MVNLVFSNWMENCMIFSFLRFRIRFFTLSFLLDFFLFFLILFCSYYMFGWAVANVYNFILYGLIRCLAWTEWIQHTKNTQVQAHNGEENLCVFFFFYFFVILFLIYSRYHRVCVLDFVAAVYSVASLLQQGVRRWENLIICTEGASCVHTHTHTTITELSHFLPSTCFQKRFNI